MSMILEELKNKESVVFIQNLIRDEIIKLSKEPEQKYGSVIYVRRSEFDELKDIVKELAIDQKETKKELRLLAEAQKRTEIKIEQLAEAQKNTEIELRTLTITVKDIQKQLGGLAMDVGYGNEDKIMPYICDFGKKVFDIDVTLIDRRDIFYPDGRYDQINIYTEGTKDGVPSFIIGECKAQPAKKDAVKFNQILERLKNVLSGNIYAFIVGYHFDHEVETYIKNEFPNIRMIKTFEFEMKYKKSIPQ